MKTMNKILTLLAITASTASTAAMADELFDNYAFDAAADAHARAITMSEKNAVKTVGNFKMIATASRSYRGEFQKKDMNGIANQDGSVLGLQITQQSTGNLVQVIQLNLQKNGQNQGPTIPVFNPDGSMAFAQFSYKNGEVSDAVLFHSECKLRANDTLLCAKRFIVNDDTDLNPQQKAMNNTIVGYDLYTR